MYLSDSLKSKYFINSFFLIFSLIKDSLANCLSWFLGIFFKLLFKAIR